MDWKFSPDQKIDKTESQFHKIESSHSYRSFTYMPPSLTIISSSTILNKY